jgi:hypothetical protein
MLSVLILTCTSHVLFVKDIVCGKIKDKVIAIVHCI